MSTIGQDSDVTSAPSPRRAGRRSAPARSQILECALALVDREGAQALTMRRLAEELETSPMSLYGQVNDRDDVLDGVYDLILRQVDLSGADTLPWQRWARQAWGTYRRALLLHPNAVAAVVRRPAKAARSASFSAATELPLRVFRKAGLSVEAAVHAQRMLVDFTFGAALVEINWLERQNVLRDEQSITLVGTDFPHVVEALPFLLRPDFEQTFDLGLTLLIEGIERQIEAAKRAT
jgi:AcrR family transcriptional regulator